MAINTLVILKNEYYKKLNKYKKSPAGLLVSKDD